ncbi:MAG: flagellar biosynthesis protein FlgD [Afipia sp.]|nr:flagellar biosynthesis protein FlgD [Afipia sp.]
MAVDATMPTTVKSAAATPPATSGTSTNTTSSTSTAGLASNFQTFLTLLTTQLQNQNPLDPLDTNQFTAQLVQFAQVEQQLKANDQLTSLVALQKTAQSTQALNFVGSTVAVDGSTVAFNGSATWNLNAAKDANATITISNSAGQEVYNGGYSLKSGNASFVWDGKGNDGTQWPAGNYKMTVSAKDSQGQPVTVSTEIQGVVDSVDLTASPALLSMGGNNYTVDQIKRVIRATTSSSS